MERFVDLIAECLPKIKEIMSWDVVQLRQEDPNLLILDIREPMNARSHVSIAR